MKAKKISMAISISLFLSGLILAFIFAFVAKISPEWKQLLVSLSIGMSTGGLVATLIEVPLTISNVNMQKHILKANSFYIYLHCKILISRIDKACNNDYELMFKDFCASAIQQIVQFAIPLTGIEPHIYFCSCKREKIEVFTYRLNDFILHQSGSIDIKFKLKYNILQREAISTKQEENIYSKDVKFELCEMKSRLLPLCEIIDNTLNLVLSEKEFQTWQAQKARIVTSIEQESRS